MKKIKITVMKKVCHKDLIERYENPLENACDMEEGAVFIADGWKRPADLCESAWESMSPFVLALSHGAEDFYEGWMKNKKSVMISCNDGFRPVSFLIETLDEDV
ncbi:MAG: TIGR04076 family protein [Selenomonadaceae bacterium]|nr:TIGR04076 family protein [Selenomonadaceae bacterium]